MRQKQCGLIGCYQKAGNFVLFMLVLHKLYPSFFLPSGCFLSSESPFPSRHSQDARSYRSWSKIAVSKYSTQFCRNNKECFFNDFPSIVFYILHYSWNMGWSEHSNIKSNRDLSIGAVWEDQRNLVTLVNCNILSILSFPPLCFPVLNVPIFFSFPTVRYTLYSIEGRED